MGILDGIVEWIAEQVMHGLDLILLPNKNIGNLVEQKESGDPIRRML